MYLLHFILNFWFCRLICQLLYSSLIYFDFSHLYNRVSKSGLLRPVPGMCHVSLHARTHPAVFVSTITEKLLIRNSCNLTEIWIFEPAGSVYTVSQKKVPTFKLSVTLSNLDRFSNFCTAGKCMKFATKSNPHYPPHLRHVATLPWEIKNSNFCRYSASVDENANKLHLSAPIVIPPRATVYSECICVFLSKSCSRRWMPYWLLTNTTMTSAVTNVWCHKLITKVNK